MSLIKKIDAEILTIRQILVSGTFTEEVYGTLMGKIQMAERIKQIILSEQKEPCEYCGKVDFVNDHGNTFYIPMIRSEETEEDVYIIKTKEGDYELVMNGTDVKTIKISHCPVCGRPLNQPIEN